MTTLALFGSHTRKDVKKLFWQKFVEFLHEEAICFEDKIFAASKNAIYTDATAGLGGIKHGTSLARESTLGFTLRARSVRATFHKIKSRKQKCWRTAALYVRALPKKTKNRNPFFIGKKLG